MFQTFLVISRRPQTRVFLIICSFSSGHFNPCAISLRQSSANCLYKFQLLKMSIKETLSDKNKPQQDAIKALISPVNTAVESDGPEGVEKALWNTWNELIDVASKTPHSEQDHLVQIVRKTQRQAGPSKTDGSSCKVWDEEVEWDKMSLFGPALREKWNYSEIYFQDAIDSMADQM